jgi:hypothetical protein
MYSGCFMKNEETWVNGMDVYCWLKRKREAEMKRIIRSYDCSDTRVGKRQLGHWIMRCPLWAVGCGRTPRSRSIMHVLPLNVIVAHFSGPKSVWISPLKVLTVCTYFRSSSSDIGITFNSSMYSENVFMWSSYPVFDLWVVQLKESNAK